MKSNLVDLDLYLHATTEKAILVSVDGDGERSDHVAQYARRRKAVWLPKSQIEYQHRSGAIVEVTLPESLAIEKGLV